MRLGVALTVVTVSVLAAGCDPDTEPGSGEGRPGCGDGVPNGLEACDGSAFAQGATCADYQLGAGDVACTAECKLDFSGCGATDYCTANARYADGQCDACDLLGGAADADCASACGADGVCGDRFDLLAGVWTCQHAGLVDPDCGDCGNGAVEGHELCDTQAFGAGATCADYGFAGGSLGCGDTCVPEFEGCTMCGNNRRDGVEACDGVDFGGASCEVSGYRHGEIACTSSCRIDTSGCWSDPIVDAAALADAFCNYLERCVPESEGQFAESFAACSRGVEAVLECGLVGTPDRGAMDACTAALATAPCDPLEGPIVAEGCDVAFGGPGVAGLNESCESQEACAEALYCSRRVDACDVCVAAAGIGQPCGYDSATGELVECDDAVGFCDDSAYPDEVCVAKRAVGGECDSDRECESDWCRWGFCANPLPVGSPCDDDLDECAGELHRCVNGTCGDGLPLGSSCGDTDDCLFPGFCRWGECVEIQWCAVAGEGEPCGVMACEVGLYCDWTTVTCRPKSAIGGSCEWNSHCVPEAYCSAATGECEPHVGVGERCTSSRQCYDPGFCGPGGVCVLPAPEGFACASDFDCASYSCVGGACIDPLTCVP